MNSSDVVLNTAGQKLSAKGISPAIIQAIIAALTGLLSSCGTPAKVKASAQRPVMQLRLRRRLRDEGVPLASLQDALDASNSLLSESSDEELTNFIAAAQESNS